MPNVRKPHENKAHRRVSTSQPSPTRPVMSAPIAKAKGTVMPTYPRYKIGGWNTTKMWFCNSGFGPGPSSTPGAPVLNGLAGPSVSTKKNNMTTFMVANAQPTIGSFNRVRYFTTMPTVRHVSTRSHSKIEPSSALHTAVKLYNAGVLYEPTFCTYASEKSRVIIPHSIAANAAIAAAHDRKAKRGTRRMTFSSDCRVPNTAANSPKNAPIMPTNRKARPMGPLSPPTLSMLLPLC